MTLPRGKSSEWQSEAPDSASPNSPLPSSHHLLGPLLAPDRDHCPVLWS